MIKTSRCKLTTLIAADWDLFLRLYTSAEVRRFLGGVLDEKTIRLRFLQILKSARQTHHWVIRIEEDSSSGGIGIVSLSPHHHNIDTEISYQLLPQNWGRGYATEAVQAVITYGLMTLNLPRVVAETQIANIPSCRLLEKIGMHLEQTVERFGAKQGIFVAERVTTRL